MNKRSHVRQRGQPSANDTPLKDLVHNFSDKVCKKNGSTWAKLWVQWLIKQQYDSGPMRHDQEDPFDLDRSQEENKCGDEGVWFLAGPPFGTGSYGSGGTYSKFVVLSPGTWHIMASPFTSYVSKQEYPSIDTAKLFERAKKDVDTTYRLEGTLDGLTLCATRVQEKQPYQIRNIPDDNIIAPRSELLANSAAEMCIDGYFFWLKPLDAGPHLLHLVAYSRVYEFDVKFQLNVRGPRS